MSGLASVKMIVGLDIGTSKVVAIVGQETAEGAVAVSYTHLTLPTIYSV